MKTSIRATLRPAWHALNPAWLEVRRRFDSIADPARMSLPVQRALDLPVLGTLGRSLPLLRYYSQWGEDRLIGPLIPREEWIVDVGANDGLRGSNSRHFTLKGHRALCIEPDPNAFAKLSRVYESSPRVVLHNCAVGPETRLVEFLAAENSELSTLNADNSPGSKKGVPFRRIEVKVEPLDLLMEAANARPLGLLSIDVEGAEWVVLQGFDVDRWRPRFACIETHETASRYVNPSFAEIQSFFETRGYRICAVTRSNCLWAAPGESATFVSHRSPIPDILAPYQLLTNRQSGDR